MTHVTFPVQKLTRRKTRTALLGQGQRMNNWLYNLTQSNDVPQWVRDEAKMLQEAWDHLIQGSLEP